jgi:hypothetical protein
MSEEDDLRINTLHRFAKHSPRLVLQEYSHCEVPAGCGGVVLRWFDETSGLPVSLRLFAEEMNGDTWLDGQELPSVRATLADGEHVFSAHLWRKTTDTGLHPVLVALSVLPDASSDEDLLHRASPVWRMTTRAPEEGWTEIAFADDTWEDVPLAPRQLVEALDGWQARVVRDAEALGQRIYAIPRPDVWLRVRFRFAKPEGAR